ncbi:putative bifunctional diguanylate cyclase/phosphodiesterase [Massilia cavernae]|uniref:EAL domain-containing protein n=1 Tax=Massilia cavernae TaxID=2320864 RepID=A0A418Y8A1_9BURK|nr:EAL domain-containing protein [Massilia cavernae]RJG27492.1 EAL domain-containing protein [Massilia cavernae]
MSKPSLSLRTFISRPAQRGLEWVLRALSLYALPIGIALLSLIALFVWDSHYVARGDERLALRVMSEAGTPETGAPLSPSSALARLQGQPLVTHLDTKLSEAPVWFTLAPHAVDGGVPVIEFPSRHAIDLACWDAATLLPLGKSSRSGSEGALAPVKSGFTLSPEQANAPVLCRGTFVGPARLTAVQWSKDQLARSVEQYHRKSGLLDGGMIVLTLFVLTTALINRQSLYVLFAGWLILNLRVGALSAGWDTQWLGQVVPAEWLLLSRSVTIALYSVATLTLYQTLFRKDLARSRFVAPLQIMEWLCLPFLAASVLLPYTTFLPVMWAVGGFGLLWMTMGLLSIMFHLHNRVAFWFAASFAVTFVSGFAEVISAALGLRELLGVINSVTAALASSLLAALAVAEQMRLETEKRIAAQAELRHAYEAMPVGLFTLDIYGQFLSANPAVDKMLGMGGVTPGRTRFKQFFEEDVWRQLHDLVQAQPDVDLEIENREGTRRFLVRATLARNRIEGVLQDITEQAKATEQLRFMANNDPLTKIYNRRGIERMFDNAVVQMASGKPLALAYLDLDRFKLINDLFGHSAGDEVLKQVCERIAMMLGGGQTVGRVGGDEFVIVLPDTAIPLAQLICRGIVERIGATPYRVGDKAFHVRGSIGLIEVSLGMQMKDAVSTADRACREAKGGHSDGLVVYERNAAAFHEREAELNLVARLSAADATEGMFLEMQPIMSLKSPRASLNFEVLLRMRDSDGQVVSAGPIIGAAEKSGRAGVIDRWVLASTLAWIAQNIESLKNTQFVCMNLSGASLNDERFVQDTFDILARYVHVAGRLCMEITESVALHDLDNTRRFIDQVRSFGVKVALDDFGAGYTSFSYLKELPADVLKIDGNFIVNINAHPANVAIVEAIVSLAVNLGMKTIAEWAEDAATVQTLADIGVDYVQGYAIARSMAPERLLTGVSSAAFIDNDDVALLVRSLGNTKGMSGLLI